MTGVQTCALPILFPSHDNLTLTPEMLQLRYANYPKDYFMGMLPSSQYGSVAVLPATAPSLSPYRIVTNGDSPVYLKCDGSNSDAVSLSAIQSTSNALVVNADLSALSIRATEYLQRWKEVVQFSSKDYSDQMAAQFGIKAPEYMGKIGRAHV